MTPRRSLHDALFFDGRIWRLALLWLLAAPVHAQLVEEWSVTYDGGRGPTHDAAEAVAVDSAGGVLVVGRSRTDYTTEILAVRYSAVGERIWTTLLGDANEQTERIVAAVDSEGNSFVAAAEVHDRRLWKLDPLGNVAWSISQSQPGETPIPAGIEVDGSGAVYVSGRIGTAKVSADGEILWSHGAPSNDLAVGDDGTVTVAERTRTVRYGADGAVVWAASRRTELVVVDATGATYIAELSPPENERGSALTKLDRLGEELWSIPFIEGDQGEPFHLSIGPDNHLYASGWKTPDGNCDYVALKVSPDGELLWEFLRQRFDDDDDCDEVAFTHVNAGADGILLLYPYCDGDCALTHLDSEGTPQWSVARPDAESVYGIVASDAAGNAIVAGRTAADSTHSELLAAKLDIEGGEVWANTESGSAPRDDAVFSVRGRRDGGAYTLLSSCSVVDCRSVVTRHSSSGESLWTIELNPPGFLGEPAGFGVDAASNVIVGGPFGIAFFDSQGMERWRNDFRAEALTVDDFGATYALTGRSEVSLVKFDARGALNWERPLPFHDMLVAREGLCIDADGNVVVAISARGHGYGYGVAKYTPEGALLWQYGYQPGRTSVNVRRVTTDSAGNVYVAGLLGPSQTPEERDNVIRIDADGALAWTHLFEADPQGLGVENGALYVSGDFREGMRTESVDTELGALRWQVDREAQFSRVGNLAVHPDGGVCVTSRHDSFYDTVRYDTEGNELWTIEHGQIGGVGNAVSVNGRGQVFVATSEDRNVSVVRYGQSESQFRRGDANSDGDRELTDGLAILNYLFLDAPAPSCLDAADVEDNGVLQISDAIFLLSYLFLGGATPAEPLESCGFDPTIDALACASAPTCN